MWKKTWICRKCGNLVWECLPERYSTYATAFPCSRCSAQDWGIDKIEYLPELKKEDQKTEKISPDEKIEETPSDKWYVPIIRFFRDVIYLFTGKYYNVK